MYSLTRFTLISHQSSADAFRSLSTSSSKIINDENYIVVNYRANSIVNKIWVLWDAQDRFFSPRLKNSNAQSINREAAGANIEVIFDSSNQTRT